MIRTFQDLVNASGDVGQSMTVVATTDELEQVRLTTSQAGDLAWEVSADGGSNWQSIESDGQWYPLAVPGVDLRWRATLTYDGKTLPSCSDLDTGVGGEHHPWLLHGRHVVERLSGDALYHGTSSASASSGFTILATNVEGPRTAMFFYGTNGRQAAPWGNGSSYPMRRASGAARRVALRFGHPRNV